MAEAKQRLHEALGRATGLMNCPATIMTFARFLATKAVKRRCQAQGLKTTHIERQIIVSAANDYLRDHPELIEEAAETVRKVLNYEHLPNGKRASAREFTDDRDCTNHSKPNTEAIAQRGVQAEGVSDRGGSGTVDRGCTATREERGSGRSSDLTRRPIP
jgi:hypothetical protein